VDAPELVRLVIEKESITRPVFHLTFDDGLKEMVTTVAPLLQKLGIPATFFINTGFIGNREIFYRYKASVLIDRLPFIHSASIKKVSGLLDSYGIGDGTLPNRLLSVDYSRKALLDDLATVIEVNFRDYLKEHDIYMNEPDIRDLLNKGFSIGAHSIDHPEFRVLSREEQLKQTKESTTFLMKTFAVSPVLFSFPFSDEGVTMEYFTRTHNPGGPVDLSFGISGMKTDSVSRHLHRIPMETGNFSAGQIVIGEYLYYCMKALVNKNKINRK
jgi:peptidoglycan/xylan/chitin deacetylase (PgdA/CDA1 family)